MTSRIEVQKIGVRGFLREKHETWKPDVSYKRVYWRVYLRLDSGMLRPLQNCTTEAEMAYFTSGLIDAIEVADYPF